jgi:hypothetical protein
MSEATVTLISAIACTVVGIGTFFHYFLSILRWPRVTGTVTGNVADLRSIEGTHYAYFPRIEFQAANGKTYEVRGDVGLTTNGRLDRRSHCNTGEPTRTIRP